MEELINKIQKSHKNILIEGDIASGKTANIMFPIVKKIIEEKKDLFILDPKEEYIRYLKKDLNDKNYNIEIINLRDCKKSKGWNPFEQAYKKFKDGNREDAIEEISNIFKVLIPIEPGSDPFWTSSAIELLTGLTIIIFEKGKENEINLLSINELLELTNESTYDSTYLRDYLRQNKNSLAQKYLSLIVNSPKDTFASIITVAKQSFRVYASRESLNMLTSKTTFEIYDNTSKPSAIFLITKDESKSYLNNLSLLFIEQLFNELLNSKRNRQFNLILDNFDILDKTKDFMPLLSSCISRNIKTYIITREMKRIIEQYDSYISKVCDIVSVNGVVKYKNSEEEEKYDKDFKQVRIPDIEPDYPDLIPNIIKTFDLKQTLTEEATTEITEIITKMSEEIDKNKLEQIKPEFEQFKI